ncbi:hypothetical protein FB451DRAFT_1164606 [Mycena latifolia]|nr:hypothetical protein FB451DRAFT_1164606 [Mycena latifolia]
MDGVRHGETPLLDYPDYDPKGQTTAHFAGWLRPSQLKSIPVCEHGLEHCELAAAIHAWCQGEAFSAPPGIHVRIRLRAAVDEAAVGVKVASAAAVAAAACLVEVGAGGRASQGGVKRSAPRRSKCLATSGSSATSSRSSAAVGERIFIKEEERASSLSSQSSGGVRLMVDTAITGLEMARLAVESGGESSDSMPGLQTVSDSSEFLSD